MKLAFVTTIKEEEVSNPRILGKRLSVLASLGYEGVEFAIRDPELINARALEEILKKYELEVPAVGTGLAFVEEKLSLSSPEKNIRIRAINRVMRHIDFASIFNAQVVIGLIRGKISTDLEDSSIWDKCYRYLVENVERLCEYAFKKHVLLTLEPLNRYETTFLHNVDQTMDFIAEGRYDNLKILLDTFHMNIEEKNFSEPIIKTKRLISHIHFADSNRCCPGYGHIDFVSIQKTLRKNGYSCYISGEIALIPDFNSCAKAFITNVKDYFKR